jgi:hypothetical protein
VLFGRGAASECAIGQRASLGSAPHCAVWRVARQLPCRPMLCAKSASRLQESGVRRMCDVAFISVPRTLDGVEAGDPLGLQNDDCALLHVMSHPPLQPRGASCPEHRSFYWT